MKQLKSDPLIVWPSLIRVVEGIRNLYSRENPKDSPWSASLPQIRVMGCIMLNPKGQIKVKEIAEELGITSGRVSQILERLLHLGLIERSPVESDRRAVNITLSQKGFALRKGLDQRFSVLLSELLAHVPEEKQLIFTEVLETMTKNLKKQKQIDDRKRLPARMKSGSD